MANNYLLLSREKELAHIYEIGPHLGNKRSPEALCDMFVRPEAASSWNMSR